MVILTFKRKERMIPHTIRFPDEMHESIQKISKQEKISFNSLVTKAVCKRIELYIKKMEKKNGN